MEDEEPGSIISRTGSKLKNKQTKETQAFQIHSPLIYSRYHHSMGNHPISWLRMVSESEYYQGSVANTPITQASILHGSQIQTFLHVMERDHPEAASYCKVISI